MRTRTCNVLIIGSGAAGLRAAIAAHLKGASVEVLGKRDRLDAHTVLASGGINAVLGTQDPEDSFEQHFADTISEGYFLGHPRVIEIMVTEAPRAVQELAEWGCPFARTPDGKLDQRFLGAHTYRRTCYAGDYTGRAVLHTLVRKAEELRVPIIQDQYVSRILTADGACFGALAFDMHTGERTLFESDALVLATGGHTRLWRRSSSRRDENYGEGMSLAMETGCKLMDIELVQFHPTGMIWPEEAAGTLVTEAVRGEGGRLYNSLGERFMERYDPQRLELSTRDRVALANYTEIAEGRGTEHGGVLLDVTEIGKDRILERLPRMYRQFIEYQMLDISREQMEVAPTAHFSMGGIVVDPEAGSTGIAGLYAAGECAGGLHGANRLGGNSLAETVVFGRRAGEAAAAFSEETEVLVRSRKAVEEANEELDALTTPGPELARPLQRAVRNLMWDCAGVVRDEAGLQRGIKEIESIRGSLPDIDVRPGAEGWGDLAHALDLIAMCRVAEATIAGALERRESRGCHNRSDYPHLDDDLQVNLLVQLDDRGELKTSQFPVPKVPQHLKSWTTGVRVEATADRLLE